MLIDHFLKTSAEKNGKTIRSLSREALAQADGAQTRATELLGTSECVLGYEIRKYGLGGTA